MFFHEKLGERRTLDSGEEYGAFPWNVQMCGRSLARLGEGCIFLHNFRRGFILRYTSALTSQRHKHPKVKHRGDTDVFMNRTTIPIHQEP